MRIAGFLILMAFAGSAAVGSFMGMFLDGYPKSTWHFYAFVAAIACMFLVARELART